MHVADLAVMVSGCALAKGQLEVARRRQWNQSTAFGMPASADARRLALETRAGCSGLAGYQRQHILTDTLLFGCSQLVSEVRPPSHLPQDMSDSVFMETEMARAYREIAQRDPSFDMPAFLRQLRADVPVIVRAYLLGDIPALQVGPAKGRSAPLQKEKTVFAEDDIGSSARVHVYTSECFSFA